MTVLPEIDLPPPPRTPRWRAAMADRGALAWFGVALVAIGTAIVYVADVSQAVRDLALGAVMLPGVGCVMVWLRFVMRFRVLLTQGDAARARVDDSGAFTFVDRAGREHRGRAPASTPAGFATVVYDPARPDHHRLVGPSDFVSG